MLVSGLVSGLGLVAPAWADSNLEIVKQAIDLNGNPISEVESGQPFLFDILWSCSLENPGVDQCENVEIRDVIPPELEYLGLQEGSGARANYDSDTREFTYDLGTISGESASASIAIKVQFPEGTTPDDLSVINTATIASTAATPNPPGIKSDDADIKSSVENPAAKWDVKKKSCCPLANQF
ncbi:MAG: hypothetical protein HC873_02055 [Leptolyngbyaceae cyanobacterium SL_1_1]|nr:hypothetical protein [Leptolyngbyaceae cyanobacterium SL_1_1]